MSHKILKPFIVKVSVLDFFPLQLYIYYFMIILTFQYIYIYIYIYIYRYIYIISPNKICFII